MQIHKELAGDGRCTFVCSPTAIFAKIKNYIIGGKRNNVFDTASQSFDFNLVLVGRAHNAPSLFWINNNYYLYFFG